MLPPQMGLTPQRRCIRGGALLLLLLAAHPRTLAGQSQKGASRSSTTVSNPTTTNPSYTPSSSSIAAPSTSSRNIVYGSSRGVSTRAIIVGVVVVSVVAYYYGHSYYTTRFYYRDYYDDCALRNVTAASAGQGDYYIDPSTVDTLPNMLPYQSTEFDLVQFNNTLYNNTNGLIVDPAYCNSTYTGAGAAARAAVRWLLLGVVAVACLLGSAPALL